MLYAILNDLLIIRIFVFSSCVRLSSLIIKHWIIVEFKNYISEIEEERKTFWNRGKSTLSELYRAKVGKTLAANDADIEWYIWDYLFKHSSIINNI